MRIVSLIFLLNLILSSAVLAQERCATVPYMKNLLQKNGINESTEQFEQWIKQKIAQRKSTTSTLRTTAGPYQIPVVVHVIHNGQALGTGSNVLNSRIFSQIDVLNKDFNKLNTDAANTPAEFQSVAGNMNIEFVLAKSDPDGDPTTGIIRVDGQKATWNPDTEDSQLKAKSYWPSENYLNLWVTDLSGTYIGYAQFPFSNLVGGISEVKSALTDGVVIDYSSFGVGSSDPSFNLGRTATHEIGHFLGLKHIWGDENGCIASGNGSDYVDDTPNQADATTGCPSHPQVDCSTNKMFQNFLDYSDDDCMNLFTNGQVERMITILENSNRRNSLLVSPGLVAPSGLGEDLKITSIISPSPVTCSTTSLTFTIKNAGSPTITTFKVAYKIDDETTTTINFPNADYPVVGILSGEDNVQLTIPLDLPSGEHAIYFQVHSPNGVADAKPANNDTLFYTVVNNSQDNIPLRENFNNNSLNQWSAANPQNGIVWNVNQSLARVSTQNGMMGEKSWLVSPMLNFQYITEASLFFHTDPESGEATDRLKVMASVDCGITYQNLSPFKNVASNKQYVSLTSLAGYSSVRIAFVATNDLGNNIDVDNIEFFTIDDQSPFDTGNKLFAIYWQPTEINNEIRINANITFNLDEKQNVGFSVSTYLGQRIFEQVLPDILNQTMLVPVGLPSRGLYIVRLQIGKKYYTTKVYLAP